jgi:arginine-tRNA-protein transferase
MFLEDDYISPDHNGFKGRTLDDYLANGYFRMHNMIFTTHAVSKGVYGNSTMMMPVFWLRIILKKINYTNSLMRIKSKCERFNVEIKPAIVSNEIESLYTLYHSQLDFESPSSCISRLGVEQDNSPFDSWMIEVRDGEKLIAVGYFDIGQKSIMGILNIYNPQYKKYSLGKYLMIKKMEYALANNIEYYYTGYIGTEVDNFDYKIFPDVKSVEVYLPVEKEWKPYAQYDKSWLGQYFIQSILGIDESDIDFSDSFIE